MARELSDGVLEGQQPLNHGSGGRATWKAYSEDATAIYGLLWLSSYIAVASVWNRPRGRYAGDSLGK